MKKILSNQYLNLVARIFIGWIFIYAAIGKIADPVTFSKEISNYQIMPMGFINFFALALPWLELFNGLFLLFGVRIKANSLISGSLMFVFIVAILTAMLRGLNINCGCFAHKIVYVGWAKILENTGMLILCVYLFYFPLNNYSLERFISRAEEND